MFWDLHSGVLEFSELPDSFCYGIFIFVQINMLGG